MTDSFRSESDITAPSPFGMYVKNHRRAVRAELDALKEQGQENVPSLGRTMNERFKALSPEEQVRYEDEAQRYHREQIAKLRSEGAIARFSASGTAGDASLSLSSDELAARGLHKLANHELAPLLATEPQHPRSRRFD